MRFLLSALVLSLLAACATVSEPPLATINNNDPVIALTPDHVSVGDLPN